MKKYLLVLVAALTAFAACNKESDYSTPEKNDAPAVLTFTSAKPSFDSLTRTAWNAESQSIVWSSGDRIRVGYTLEGNWMSTDDVADLSAEPKKNPKFFASNGVSIDSSDPSIGTFIVPNNFTNTPSGKAIFYGLYPSNAMNGTDAEYAPSLTITLPAGQTPGNNTFDSSADIMVGNTDEITLSGSFPSEAVEMSWHRVVAHADINFANLNGVTSGETVSKITLTFNEEAKVAGSFYVNVATGAITTNSGSTNEIVLSGTNLSISSNSVKAWCCLAPVSFSSLNVVVETNAATYSRSITGLSKSFTANAHNTLTVNMSTATRTDKNQLVANGYYVISYGTYMMTVGTEANSYRGSATKNVSNPGDEAIWRINYVSASDAYTIRSLGANKDLYGATSTSSTNLDLGSGSTNLFTIEKTSSTYKIVPKGNTSRAIGYNSSTNPARFALYLLSGSQPITLDLTSVNVSETPVITIAEEERTKTVTASATSVTFTYVPNVFATTAPSVSVANNDDGIINGTPSVENGIITVPLNPNSENTAKTATLTVSGAGIASPITLTINQEAKAGEVFSYVFTSKSWAATRGTVSENWTSGKEGNGFSNGGIQVTTGATGANGTSPYTFTDISKVVVTYCTNGSSGAGSIKVQVGDGTETTKAVTKTGGTDPRTLTFDYSPKESGKVKITGYCTTNSVYIIGVDITAESMTIPTSYAITCATGLEHGTIEASKATAYSGDEITLSAHPDGGYKLGAWTVTGADSGDEIIVTNNKFTMPAEAVSVSASFVVDEGGDQSYTITFGNNANSATSISSSTNATTVISDGTSYVTSKPFTVNSGNVYYGDTQTCIRIGKSGNASQLTIALSDDGKVKAKSIVVNCENTGGKNNADATLNVNSLGAQTTTSSAADYTFTFGSATNITSIVLAGSASIKIYSITVNY